MSYESNRCAECDRLPVKSRRNSVCMACSATVCIKCQHAHFIDRHEASDEERMRKQGVIA